MKQKFLLHFIFIFSIANMAFFKSAYCADAIERNAAKLAKEMAQYVLEQIESVEKSQVEWGENQDKSFDGNFDDEVEVVPPLRTPRPFLSAFGILIGAQVSFSIPTIIKIRMVPQVDIYWGKVMPAGWTHYVPRIKVKAPQG